MFRTLLKSALLVTLAHLAGAGALLAQTPPATVQAPPGFPVGLAGEEAFRIQAAVGPFSAQTRAAAASQRLEDLRANPFAAVPRLLVVDDGSNTNVVAGDLVLFSTTPDDARLAGMERLALANQRAARAQDLLDRHTVWSRVKSLLVGLGLALLITLGAWYGLRGLRWAFRRVETRSLEATRSWFEASHDHRLTWLPVEHLQKGVRFLFRGFRLVAYGAGLYVYLSAVFSLFPWTRGLAERLFAFAWSPLTALARDVVAYLPKLFFLLLIIVATRYVLKLISLLSGAVGAGTLHFEGFHAEWAEPTYRLVRLLVLAFALVIAFPYLPGSQSEAFKGVSLFVGVLFSLGSSGAVGNMVAGVLITYMRPFKVGDRIQVGDTLGDVIERTALVTRIRTIKHVDVTVPNSTILSAQVQNFSANAEQQGLILHTTVTIGYDAPWRTVHDLLIRAALATEGIEREPAPFVLQTSLDDFYVSYQINATTRQPNRMASIYSELHTQIQETFNEGGVEITSPHYRALRDGNCTTTPTDHLPPGYEAPAFRVAPPPARS